MLLDPITRPSYAESFIGPFGLNTEWLPGKEPDNYAIKTELYYSTNAAMTKSATDAPKVLLFSLLIALTETAW
jgi:hypothetical protein